jgi:hypothetical protein
LRVLACFDHWWPNLRTEVARFDFALELGGAFDSFIGANLAKPLSLGTSGSDQCDARSLLKRNGTSRLKPTKRRPPNFPTAKSATNYSAWRAS